jgi:hypothetical protein
MWWAWILREASSLGIALEGEGRCIDSKVAETKTLFLQTHPIWTRISPSYKRIMDWTSKKTFLFL